MDDKTRLLQQVADLTLENRRLREELSKYKETCTQPIDDSNQNSANQKIVIDADKYKLFTSFFRGRSDVYSRRSSRPNPKTGKCGYYAQIDYASKEKKYRRLTGYDVIAHLKGEKEDCSDVIGIYPTLPDETCYFLVFDFDNHDDMDSDINTKKEINVLRQTCLKNNIGHLVERSRSGRGYHFWLFFEEAIPVSLARDFGTALLTKCLESVGFSDFKTFDRMIPTSDYLPINRKTGKPGIGNMVALPLQGQALKRGNTTFIDEKDEPYSDQWEILAKTQKLPIQLVKQKIDDWGKVTDTIADEEKPWEIAKLEFQKHDAGGGVRIILANGIYVDKTNISPRLQNHLRRLAAFNNKEYYKKQAMGFSTYNTPRIIYCGEDVGNYLHLPRGVLEILIKEFNQAGITYKIIKKQNSGKKINASFNGKLFPEQKQAVRELTKYNDGVLSAATAFGKTVLGAYLISKHKVNTLILVHNYEIMKNWQDDLSKFLKINHEIPVKYTPKGRRKKLNSIIGTLKSTSDTTTGIVDIAMISSLGKSGEINPIVKEYGMVIMDECHHSPAKISDGVLREVNSKYLYGLTATPIRNDGLERKIFMSLGPVRYRYSAKDRAKKTNFDYVVKVKTTSFCTSQKEIYDVYSELTNDRQRNNTIITDAIELAKSGKSPIIVTRFKSHAEHLYNEIGKSIKNTFLLTGGRKRSFSREKAESIPDDEPIALVATGQYIGKALICRD